MKIRNTAGIVCIKNICMTEGSACTGMRALKRRFTGSNMRAGRNTPLFSEKRMHGIWGGRILSWKVDALVPVPVPPARKRKRGYNQAELLALEIGKQLGLRVENNWLIRTKNTVPQKLLNGQERRNNLKKAFKAGQNDVKLNAIVIIDDIYTTGSTIDAMAAVCRQQGVSRIYFAALSIGNGQEVR